MTYADLLDRDNIESNYLAVLKPRRIIDGFTLDSGTKYYASWDFGKIISVSSDGVDQGDEASDSTLADGDWYLDRENDIFWIDNSTTITNFTIVATYEIYIGTRSQKWYRVPDDDTTEVVYYEEAISSDFQIKQNTRDNLFGFLASESTSITIGNIDDFMTRHVYASSFNQAEISVFHYLDALNSDNLQSIFRGFMSNPTFDESRISIKIFDENSIFNKDFTPQYAAKYYNTTLFSDLDPIFNQRPIRQLYGRVGGFIPVNVDYEEVAPSTANNREWVVGSVPANNNVTVGVSTGTSNLTNISDSIGGGVNVGDTIYNEDTGEYTVVRTKIGNVITHDTWTAASNGDTIHRYGVSSVIIVQGGRKYQCYGNRDYDVSFDATNDLMKFTFKSTMEANVSLPNTLSPSDLVYCDAYGKLADVTYGEDSPNLECMSNPVGIIYDILVNIVGIDSTDIDSVTFTDINDNVLNAYNYELSFAVPQNAYDNFPKVSDVLVTILRSHLLKLYRNEDNKWALDIKEPLGAVDKTISDDEIFDGDITYRFDYSDILSRATVNYRYQEVNPNGIRQDYNFRYSTDSDVGTYLHQVDKEVIFDTYLHGTYYNFGDNAPELLSQRLAYYYGDRLGKILLKAPKRFLDTQLGDNIKISRERLPGFSKVTGTDRERETEVLGISRSRTNVDLELDDQKGIEDNSGSW